MVISIKRVLISDPVDPVCAEILQENGIATTMANKWSKEKLMEELPNFDALIVRSETKVTEEVLKAAPHLHLVGRAGTGVDNVDIDAATRRGVLVMNTPGGNTLSAAEHTCAMIAALARHIPQACAALKLGYWDRKLYTGVELSGKTLAVLGLGRIGREVAFRMEAFGMKVIGYDPILTCQQAAEFNVEKLELEQIWPRADFITVHTPYMNETKNLINKQVLMQCKPTVRIVNVARGGIIDEEALLEALEQGRCAGAALDVFIEEPPKSESVSELLTKNPRVVCTPHLGASTVEAQKRVAVDIAKQIVDLVQGHQMVGVVNAPNLAGCFLQSNKSWIILAQSLGYIASSLAWTAGNKATDCRSVEIEVSDNEVHTNLDLLSSAALVGHFTGMTPNGINLINSLLLAKENGMQVSTRRSKENSYEIHGATGGFVKFLVTLKAKTIELIGCVQNGNPVLLAINNTWFCRGVHLAGNMILVQGSKAESLLPTVIWTLAEKTSISSITCTKRESDQEFSWIAVQIEDKLQQELKQTEQMLFTQFTF